MDLLRYSMQNNQCQHCICNNIKIPLLDSKINQFYYNVLTNPSFYLRVAFDWCNASLFKFVNHGFITICLLSLDLCENTKDAIHGHCHIT